MNILEERFVKVTLNGETFFRVVNSDGELGERMDEDELNNVILDAVYSEIVEEEYMIDLAQVNTVIQCVPNIYDRQILQNFYNYAVRVDSVD